MKTKIILWIIALVIAGLIGGCSDSSTSVDSNDNSDENEEESEQVTTGILEVHVSTNGSEPDSDGYVLTLNNTDEKQAAVEDTVFFEDLEEESHEVELSGIAENCTVEGDNPQSLNITAGDTTTVSFAVGCESQGSSPLVDMIAYESSGESGGYSKIYVMEKDGSNPELLHEIDGSNALDPDISPDGKSIVFSAGGFDNFIYVMNSDGSAVTQLTTDDDDANDYGPVWSPDGTQIAFERDEDIYVMNADGSEQQNITDTPDFFEEDPAWSPDGQKIVFAQGEDDSYSQDEGNLYIMDADGSNSQPLTQTAADIDRQPAWSPDGSQIAFARRPDGEVFEVFIIDSDGSNLFQVTELPDDATEYSSRGPAWSPDGSRIAFTGRRSGGTSIHLINPDGTNEVALDNGTINHSDPDWSPAQ